MGDVKKPTAIETMARTILRALDVDVEALKSETITRIAQFEQNVKTLNETLILLHEGVKRIEAKQDEILARQRYEGGRVEVAQLNGPQS